MFSPSIINVLIFKKINCSQNSLCNSLHEDYPKVATTLVFLETRTSTIQAAEEGNFETSLENYAN
jgi:hypothetical protein